ncbi:MAG: Mov34/MPN/PAD-1 family protein [Candidatus Eisenbacteria bacterium]
MSEYEYRLILFREDGTRLDETGMRADWEPAIEWARFSALRSGRLPPGAADERISVLPAWDPRAGEPLVEGFVIDVASNGDHSPCAFSITYFYDQAAEASARLVDKGLLKGGDPFLYAVKALPSGGQTPNGTTTHMKFRTVESRRPFRAREARLSTFMEGAITSGDPVEGDFPFFLPERVLREAVDRCRRAAEGGVETAGILAGRLVRDSEAPEAFVEATAQIPARHTVAERDKLIFTPETWSDAHQAIERRNRGEIPVGWYHSHPIGAWLRESAEEKHEVRLSPEGFFSAQDRLVHLTVFPAGFHLAIVVTVPGDSPPTISSYGWRRGVIEKRGVYITKRPRPEPVPGNSKSEKARTEP